jgi:hypothetical protein
MERSGDGSKPLVLSGRTIHGAQPAFATNLPLAEAMLMAEFVCIRCALFVARKQLESKRSVEALENFCAQSRERG